MRLKKVVAATAIALAATGTATLATSTPAHALPPGEYMGTYSTSAQCHEAGDEGQQNGEWDSYLCTPWGNGYALWVRSFW